MADSALLCVGPDDVAATWPMVEAMIDAAYAELDEPTPDVRAWLLAGDGLLWVCAEDDRVIACCTTSIVAARKGRALRMVAAGAQGNDAGAALWRSHIGQIETYAKDQGCYKVACDGRRGWVRVLPGYDAKCVSFEKRI